MKPGNGELGRTAMKELEEQILWDYVAGEQGEDNSCHIISHFYGCVWKSSNEECWQEESWPTGFLYAVFPEDLALELPVNTTIYIFSHSSILSFILLTFN